MGGHRAVDPARQARRAPPFGGGARGHERLLYVLETGCQWRHLPRDLPPRSTVHGYLQRWEWDGTLEAVHHQLYVACREQAGKEASPTAAILDSKSVKAAEKGGRRSTRSASMRARRSRAPNTTSSSTRSDCC